MQIYAVYKNRLQGGNVAKSAGTGFAALIGTLFSAKLCPICLGVILGFVGIGGSTTLFLFSYKKEIMIASILILTFTIYLSGRRITKIRICKNCK